MNNNDFWAQSFSFFYSISHSVKAKMILKYICIYGIVNTAILDGLQLAKIYGNFKIHFLLLFLLLLLLLHSLHATLSQEKEVCDE